MPTGTRANAPGPISKSVGATLAGALGDRSQSEIGRVTGIEQSMLSRMFSGKKAITVDEFVAISRALGMNPADVIRTAAPEAPSSEPAPAADQRTVTDDRLPEGERARFEAQAAAAAERKARLEHRRKQPGAAGRS